MERAPVSSAAGSAAGAANPKLAKARVAMVAAIANFILNFVELIAWLLRRKV